MMSIAKEKGIPVIEVDRRKLDEISNYTEPPGRCGLYHTLSLCGGGGYPEDRRRSWREPFVLILDEIQDPHNLGSIIRTAELSGVHGVIIPKRRSIGVNTTVFKTSAGAVKPHGHREGHQSSQGHR